VYPWAGRFRTVPISKGGSMFCDPEHIPKAMRSLFVGLKADGFFAGLSEDQFARKAAYFLAELNAIHPFREGNGRTQLAFLTMLAEKAGHPIDLDRLEPAAILNAMIASFIGNGAPLAVLLRTLLQR
jgi:cell filamentation protein